MVTSKLQTSMLKQYKRLNPKTNNGYLNDGNLAVITSGG